MVPVIIRASKVGDLAVIVMPKNIYLCVSCYAYLTVMAPPVLAVLWADVSVELPTEYGAPGAGVPRAQRLSGDVKVLPGAQEVRGYWVEIVPPVLDPIIVVIAAGESLSASGLISMPAFIIQNN